MLAGLQGRFLRKEDFWEGGGLPEEEKDFLGEEELTS